MTSKGLVVTEEQEEISGLPLTSDLADLITSPPSTTDTPPSPSRKSPIAELLYMRWLEGLKLKWPSIIS
jgi:serine/threonine-protein kinase 24/25/MST4